MRSNLLAVATVVALPVATAAHAGRTCESRPLDVHTVVPGHGAVSPRSALAVTQALIAEKGPAAVEALRRSQRRPQ